MEKDQEREKIWKKLLLELFEEGGGYNMKLSYFFSKEDKENEDRMYSKLKKRGDKFYSKQKNKKHIL